MKKILAVLLTVLMLLGLAACGSTETSRTLIGISLPTQKLQRWSQDGLNMKTQLEAAGYTVEIRYADNDLQTQASQIEAMITNGCKVLIVGGIDSTFLGATLDKAKENNIPVIAYDRLLLNSDAVSAYVTFDTAAVGKMQGQYIVDTLGLASADGKTFNIELVTGDPGDSNVRDYFDGALSVLQPYLDNGTLVCPSGETTLDAVVTADWESEAAQSRFENLLADNYPEGVNLDAVLASNDALARGVTAALDASGYAGTYPVITGQDCDLDSVKNIISGKQAMSVFKDTRVLAQKAVEVVTALVDGTELPVNDTTTYNNGAGIVPACVCDIQLCTVDNYQQLLVDSGYYNAALLQ